MKIKETIYTEIDDQGRVIRRSRKVETYESRVERGYDIGTFFGERVEPRRSSFNRIMEAYDDYCRCNQW